MDHHMTIMRISWLKMSELDSADLGGTACKVTFQSRRLCLCSMYSLWSSDWPVWDCYSTTVLKNREELIEKCYLTTQAKEKYEKVLDELNNCTQPYIESMEQVFDQCQHFEEKRLRFIREVLLDMKHHLNLTEDQRFEEQSKILIRWSNALAVTSHCFLTA